eukprot:gene9450-19630_t
MRYPINANIICKFSFLSALHFKRGITLKNVELLPRVHFIGRLNCNMASDSKVFDAHCHLQYQPDNFITSFSQNEFYDYHFALMGTRPQDWPQLIDLYNKYPGNIQCALGLHPWFAHAPGTDNWLEIIRTHLLSNPAWIIGEIGLDRLWKPPDSNKNEWEAQLNVFQMQLDLAIELQRPISIHCVKSDGTIFDILSTRTSLPPAIYFHSYGGSIDTSKRLLKIKTCDTQFYFGFSAAVNTRSPKTPDVIKNIPDDRILLESDLEDCIDVKRDLDIMIGIISQCKVWTRSQTIEITNRNAYNFYNSR